MDALEALSLCTYDQTTIIAKMNLQPYKDGFHIALERNFALPCSGDCVVLSEAIRRHCSHDRQLFLAYGEEPQYFFNGRTHTFLVSTEELSHQEKKEHLSGADFLHAAKDPWVLDPSFKKHMPFAESGYVINRINLRPKLEEKLEVHVKNGFSMPLTIQEDTLYLIHAHSKWNNKIGIGAQKKFGERVFYDLTCKEIDEFSNEHMRKFIATLREQYA